LPGRQAWKLLEEAARSEGLADFFLDIARRSEWRRSAWVRPLAHAVTLGDAIRAMCLSYVREIPMVALGLSVEDDVAWFWRRRNADVRTWDGNEPAEQYMLSFMLAVVRVAAGPDWWPERLVLESPSSGWSSARGMLPDIRVETDRPQLALAIPRPLLSLPVSIAPPRAPEPDGEPAAEDFQGGLRQVMRAWIAGGLPSQEQAAQLVGTSPRTLRRRLAEEGTCWRALTQDLAFERAVARLQDGRTSVGELAEELGYSDPTHFARFFRRRAGVPPGFFRDEIAHAAELARRSRAS
jgi:AraC-like DNA-binding protein